MRASHSLLVLLLSPLTLRIFWHSRSAVASRRNLLMKVLHAGNWSRLIRNFAMSDPFATRPTGECLSNRSAHRTRRWRFMNLALVDIFGGARQARIVCLSFLDAFPQADMKTANKGWFPYSCFKRLAIMWDISSMLWLGNPRSPKTLTAFARSHPPSLIKPTGRPETAITFWRKSAMASPVHDIAADTAMQWTLCRDGAPLPKWWWHTLSASTARIFSAPSAMLVSIIQRKPLENGSPPTRLPTKWVICWIRVMDNLAIQLIMVWGHGAFVSPKCLPKTPRTLDTARNPIRAIRKSCRAMRTTSSLLPMTGIIAWRSLCFNFSLFSLAFF